MTSGKVKDSAFVVPSRLSNRVQKPVQPNASLSDLDILRSCEDREGFNEILLKYRKRLRKTAAMRINVQLQGRVDASDIIQDAYVEASRTLDKYLENPKISPFLWLRRLVGEKLIQAHRFHMGAKKRTVNRDVPIANGMPAATSQSVAAQLVGDASSPSEVAVRNENKRRLMKSLDKMNPIDREVLVLRHFEQLNGKQAAEILGISHEAAKKRYIRALEKLEQVLSSLDDTSNILKTRQREE